MAVVSPVLPSASEVLVKFLAAYATEHSQHLQFLYLTFLDQVCLGFFLASSSPTWLSQRAHVFRSVAARATFR